MAKILVIDDESEFSEELSRQLQQAGHEVRCLDNAEDGLHVLDAEVFNLVLLDNGLNHMSGLEFLAAQKKRSSGVPPVILMTGASNADTAIQAMKMGAFDYVIKPIDFDAYLPSMQDEINRALKIGRPIAPVPMRKENEAGTKGESCMIGESKQMLAVFKSIAETEADESVLILGETGTGKDLVARAIHTYSTRMKHPFVAINCGGLSENLLESELFGHEKGAWTGADKMRKGCFEHADGGTLFLDEVGDMPPAMQVKLLRVLQNREITRMGSNAPISVDVRVLAATSHDLVALVHQGKFRLDLFFRLEDTTIVMPPLRERKEDLELLAKHFLKQMCGDSASMPTIHADALKMLRENPWPGNIRQLVNVMRRARRTVRARNGTEITPEDLNFGKFAACRANEPLSEESALAGLRQAIAWAWTSSQPDLWHLLEELLKRELIRYSETQAEMSEVKLARKLGMAKNTLRGLLKELRLDEASDASA